ncbi:MAG: HEAT repeat domain-containing protein, partial [Deltaproteobacteria bacterium]|nr:HEAT repeat domain-containing protein [Deltaproteobacteria bacterium]
MPRDTSARRSWITFVAMSLGVLPLALITLGIPGAEGLPESLWERLAAQRTTAAGYRATDAVDERGEQDGGESMTWEERMRRLLDAIPTDHDVLINVSAGEMPGTSDLTRLGRRATPALARALLNNMNDDVRAICAGILGEIRDPAATEALVLALEDSVPSVRFAAAGSLGSLGDTRYAQRLMAMITNPEEEEWVKGAAIDALGRIGAPGSFDLLLRLVHSERYLGLQGSIINALWLARGSVSRGKLIAVFIDVLRKDEPAAGTVIAYLGWLQAADAVKPLADYYVGRADWVKNSIVLAMGRIGTPAARTFLRAVMMDPQKVRHINNAAIALADMGDREWVVENLA